MVQQWRIYIDTFWRRAPSRPNFLHYRPQRSCGQGNIFAPVCHSVHRGGVYPSIHCRRYPSMPCSRSLGRGCAIPACIAGGIPACLAAGLWGGGVLSQHALQEVSQHALQQVSGAGGCYPSMHCRRYPSMPCSRSPGVCVRHMVNERPVRILLECILVFVYFSGNFGKSWIHLYTCFMIYFTW